jgi:hypothetical protein
MDKYKYRNVHMCTLEDDNMDAGKIFTAVVVAIISLVLLIQLGT